jgi:hypothetical protein
MMAVGLNKDFGVLAVDSSYYDTTLKKVIFQGVKLYYTANYLMAFIGTPVYLANIKREKLGMDLISLIVHLESYLKNERPHVEKILKSEIADPDENKPDFCLFVLGIHKKLPTLVQFNSFLNFKPKYLYSEGKEVKFSTIFYGDDNPEKKKLFIETTAYMEKKMELFKGETVTPGIVAEVLARGIYHKADSEMKIGPKKKYAGGIVNAAAILANGYMLPLSGQIGA